MQGANHPDLNDLRRIRSLSQFDDQQLQNLASRLEIETADAGACLIELGSNASYDLYLVEGRLRGIRHDQIEDQFRPAIDGEMYPVARLRPSLYRVLADGPVRFFRLHPAGLEAFARETIDQPAADIAGDLFAIDDTAEQSMFEIQLFRDLVTGELNLPSLPDVAQRIQQAFADNLVTPETVGVIIQSDPVITAKMIMVVNSALYGGRISIDSLQQAVARLGLENTRKLVMTFVIKELFTSKSTVMKAHMQAVWKRSMHVASLCRVLAERLGIFDPEQAQLAGLVHVIGEVAILQYAQQNEALCSDTEELFAAVKSLRARVTGMLLQEWKFSQELVDVGLECDDWFRNPADQPDLCDLVLIARYHAMIGTPEQAMLPPLTVLPAFAKLGMGDLAIDEIIEFLDKSREKIKLVEAHLGSL